MLMVINVTISGFFMPGFWQSIQARVSLEGTPFDASWAFFVPPIQWGKAPEWICNAWADKAINGCSFLMPALLVYVHTAIVGGWR